MSLATPELKADITTRLKRIEGQVRGVQKMVEDDRACPDVLQQMAAIRSAVHQASLLLARAYLGCLVEESQAPIPEDVIDRMMSTLAKLE